MERSQRASGAHHQQDSQKGLQAAAMVCHPRGWLSGCLEGYSKITPAADRPDRPTRPGEWFRVLRMTRQLGS